MSEGRNKKPAIWTEIGRFGTLSALLIQRWLKMMYNVWGSIEEVPYGFSMWCVKFKGHTDDKITDFDQNWVFPEIMQKSWRAIEEVPIHYEGISLNLKITRAKNCQFWPQFSLSRL